MRYEHKRLKKIGWRFTFLERTTVISKGDRVAIPSSRRTKRVTSILESNIAATPTRKLRKCNVGRLSPSPSNLEAFDAGYVLLTVTKLISKLLHSLVPERSWSIIVICTYIAVRHRIDRIDIMTVLRLKPIGIETLSIFMGHVTALAVRKEETNIPACLRKIESWLPYYLRTSLRQVIWKHMRACHWLGDRTCELRSNIRAKIPALEDMKIYESMLVLSGDKTCELRSHRGLSFNYEFDPSRYVGSEQVHGNVTSEVDLESSVKCHPIKGFRLISDTWTNQHICCIAVGEELAIPVVSMLFTISRRHSWRWRYPGRPLQRSTPIGFLESSLTPFGVISSPNIADHNQQLIMVEVTEWLILAT